MLRCSVNLDLLFFIYIRVYSVIKIRIITLKLGGKKSPSASRIKFIVGIVFRSVQPFFITHNAPENFKKKKNVMQIRIYIYNTRSDFIALSISKISYS